MGFQSPCQSIRMQVWYSQQAAFLLGLGRHRSWGFGVWQVGLFPKLLNTKPLDPKPLNHKTLNHKP